jgi:hypothetical protein
MATRTDEEDWFKDNPAHLYESIIDTRPGRTIP